MWKTSEKVTFTQLLANSTAEGNEERIHASVESSRSWETRAAWAGLLDGDSRPPAARPPLAGSLNHNPICLSCLFSAGSPRGCSFDGQVQRLCVSVRELLSELAHTHSCQHTTPGTRPLFTLQLERWRTGWGRRSYSLPPASLPPAPLGFAGLCGAQDV